MWVPQPRKSQGPFWACPGNQGTRGTFLARLLSGRHPQTQESFHANPRPCTLDTTVATRPVSRRIWGKKDAASGLGECTSLAGTPDNSLLDEVADACGYVVSLEADTPTARGEGGARGCGSLEPREFFDGLSS